MSIGKLTAWHCTLMALNPSLPLVLHTQLDCNSTNWGSRPHGHWPHVGSTKEAQRPKVKNRNFELISNGKMASWTSQQHVCYLGVWKATNWAPTEQQLSFSHRRAFVSQVVSRAGAREKAAALGLLSSQISQRCLLPHCLKSLLSRTIRLILQM